MKDKSKKILVICPHPEDVAPGQRLKYEQYFTSWRRNGYVVDVAPFFSKRMQRILYGNSNTAEKMLWVIWSYCKRIMLLRKLRQYDLLYIFLWVTPFGFPIMERLYTLMNPHFIYDIDDAIFMNEKSVANRKADWIKGRKKPFFLMKKAKHVLTGTPFLAQVAHSYNPNVSDISVTINTDVYQPENTFSNDKMITIGWSGSHSTSRFLYLLKDVLLRVYQQIPFRLLVMGDEHFTIEGLPVEAYAWSVEKEVPMLQRFDIGLYPLPLDSPWVLGKSGGKALQYMAVGIPVVATAIGANFRIVTHNVNGMLVKSDDEWVEALLSLMKDPSLRKSIGEAARKTVLEQFSVKCMEPVYLSLLDKCAKP